ncbi:MAG: lysine--tRNA ligase [Candidatus Omnitrophica bacterium]|nr:lysine--tRNA ligase [Candidatus Omnitrophota bacterium]MBD3269883.1 lysine--tRNA ligase [Candidatus Omnitrophota bacterium]
MNEQEKLKDIVSEFGDPFSESSFCKSLNVSEIIDSFEEEKEVSCAGRLVSKREHGKSGFAHIMDYTGKLQIYAQSKLPGEGFKLFKELDIGDIIGVKGKLFKTRTGELTIMAEELTLLSKTLRPLPEKWHGLKDVETRYRQRYLDLISNPGVREVFIKRSLIISLIRSFFRELSYMEVETPMLQPLAGGAAGRPFVTHHNVTGSDVYLRIAPELYLKRLLVGGFEKVFEINRSFRNEGVSTRHNPEFTMLEAYCAYQNYEYMMKVCEDLFSFLAKEVNSSLVFEYQGKRLDFTPPWQRISFAGLFEKEFGIKAEDSQEIMVEKISRKLKLQKELSRSQILNITEELIERNYPQDKPTFIVDFFTWTSPLAKTKKDNPYLVERFELFIAGLEVANAYSELNNPVEQRRRFERQMETEEELPKKIDEDFVLSLEHGMPPAAGLGIGIDRLVMLLLNQPSIRDVILFPLLKSLSR